MLIGAVASRAPLYPGIFIPGLDRTGKVVGGEEYFIPPSLIEERTHTEKGSPLRVEGAIKDVFYFMPVWIDGIEMPNAVISVSQSKVIVKTEMPESNGTVKEYISLSDMQIDVVAVLVGTDGNYPEKQLEQINELWRKNEAVPLISALTDMLLPSGTKVVLEELTIDPVGEYEEMQTFSLKMVSDEIFELEIE